MAGRGRGGEEDWIESLSRSVPEFRSFRRVALLWSDNQGKQAGKKKVYL
jgi:hypothetical protein